ncbi:hypothetical protein KEM55_009310 [Ascosphaera atra]|nr:hypothetical protein KEM55_009310 [Ascosphaera atra]
MVIYLVRHTLNAIFNYAIQKTSDQLLDLQKQRDETIDRLKEATKYNSTQKLLRKYASKPSSPAINGNGNNGDDPGDGTKRGGRKQRNSMSAMPGRTNLPPPPTANIRSPSSVHSLEASFFHCRSQARPTGTATLTVPLR